MRRATRSWPRSPSKSRCHALSSMADRLGRSATQTTTKLRAYLTLAALGTLAGLVFARPELVALTAPLAVYVALGVSAARRLPQVTIEGSPPAGRVLEGER